MALDLSALRRIIADENRLLTGADIPAEYQSDVLGRVHGSAEALAFPLSTEEVSALLRYARAPRSRHAARRGDESCRLYRAARGRHHPRPFPHRPRARARRGHDDRHGRARYALAGLAGLCLSARAVLPARSRRKGLEHRRQHQHERRRHARGEVRRHARLCARARGRAR